MPGARVCTYAASQLTEALTISGDRAKIPSGDFAEFVGGWGANDWIYCAIRSATAREVVKVNIGESNVFQGLKIDRGQDGDTAAAWPAGSLIYQVLNAAMLHNILYEGQYREVAYNPNTVLAALYFGEKVYQADEVLWWMGVGGTEWRLIAGVKQVATPTIAPAAGSYDNLQSVTLECLTPGASIYYTTDGSGPDETATLYTGPFLLPSNATTTVKAIGIHPDRWWTDSAIASAAYMTSTQPAATPTISFVGGQVYIECATTLATIRYTLDNAVPVEDWQVYTGPFIGPDGVFTFTVWAYAEESPDGGVLWSESSIAEQLIQAAVGFVSAGYEHTVGTLQDGTCVATGLNNDGQCDVSTWVGVDKACAGYQTTIGLLTNGLCLATGVNWSGECNVSGWSGIADIVAANSHTLGLKADGTCVVAGAWGNGNLITGVQGWTGLTAVSSWYSHTVGLKADGTCVAAGNNSYGQITGVTSWAGITAIAAGYSFTVGLKADGTCVAAGTINTSTLSSWAGITAIEAGQSHVVGLKGDGTCVAAGSNTNGECDVTGWTGIVAVTAGNGFTIGVKGDGTCVAVGKNDRGQCNIGTWEV